jgi:hypothetical protein
MMTEHRFLASMFVGNQLHAHAYLACRKDPDRNSCLIGELLVETVEKHFKGFLPMVMLTPLKTGKPVELALTRRGAKDAIDKLRVFKARKSHVFYCVWMAPADDPDSQKLMDLH